MGAYLSEPKTTKESSDLEGPFCDFGASSMQGWRVSQEDAHNCILEFDNNTSLFAVYDGHGGHEVAEYCSKYLPDFIKKNENYLKGNYEQALKDAFLGFDETLVKPEVIEELKKIVGLKEDSKGNADQESSEEDEPLSSLVEEACMPLDEVMAKYKAGGGGPLGRVLGESGKPPVSPMLRARRSDGPSSSTSSAHKGDGEVSSSSSTQVLCNGDVHVNGEVDDTDCKSTTEAESKVESSEVKEEVATAESEKSDKSEKKSARTELEPDSSGVGNGETELHDVSSSSENGGVDSSGDGITSSSPAKKKKKVFSLEYYKNLLRGDSDSEEEDETFVAEINSDEDSDEAGDDGTGEKDEDEEESSEEEEEDDEDDDDVEFPGMEMKEEPGWESGCTAVVALLVGRQLLVANAGDSRCVVCRKGEAVEMSVDHKPEDEPERERIETAGGKVTCDGRVNGGLNLSRALGDHYYKQVKLLPASKQMITALPDVRTLTVDPVKDEFMVLACDGIWNCMTSQEVVDFVRVKLEQKTERLSQICEELFNHCLAPDTMGDGTGCDNMTCVIVRFKPTREQEVQETATPKPEAQETTTLKRPAEEAAEPEAKKSRVQEEAPDA